MSGESVRRPAADDVEEPRRRFRRRNDRTDGGGGDAETLAAVLAELVLLREENARLKAAQHQRTDISRLIGRARSLSTAEIDHASISDDTEQVLVEGLLIRESLLEICQEIERSMVSFEAKLNALAAVTAGRSRPQEKRADPKIEQTNGHGAGVA
jgi:hypothetical protein